MSMKLCQHASEILFEYKATLLTLSYFNSDDHLILYLAYWKYEIWVSLLDTKPKVQLKIGQSVQTFLRYLLKINGCLPAV